MRWFQTESVCEREVLVCVWRLCGCASAKFMHNNRCNTIHVHTCTLAHTNANPNEQSCGHQKSERQKDTYSYIHAQRFFCWSSSDVVLHDHVLCAVYVMEYDGSPTFCPLALSFSRAHTKITRMLNGIGHFFHTHIFYLNAGGSCIPSHIELVCDNAKMRLCVRCSMCM